MSLYKIAMIRGDGIGPELIDSATCILNTINDNSSVKFALIPLEAGDGALSRFNNALPEFTLSAIRKSDACLKGPVGESAADVILVIRQLFDLYANIRPIKAYPNTNSLKDGVDLVIVRENTEDLYLGWEFWSDDETVISLRRISKKAIERITEYGFKLARLRDKTKKVSLIHKANVLKKSDGFFRKIVYEIASLNSDIRFEEMYVDACAMNLIRNPQDFDVIVTSNLFGDILSDEAAQVVGGLGMGPAANIGNHFGVFEPVHGAAFDIQNKNISNPISILLSTELMLQWLGTQRNDKQAILEADRIENAVVRMLSENRKTKDLGGNLTTEEFTRRVVDYLYSN
jgi:3-isopropylmalate dehydrogenase